MSSSSDEEFLAEQPSSNSEGEYETLAELQLEMCSPQACTVNRMKKKASPKVALGKKKHARRNKTPTTNDDSKKMCSTSCTPEELLLVAKAFMKVSSNAKHGTDKKAEKNLGRNPHL
jgi:hypothetical protein